MTQYPPPGYPGGYPPGTGAGPTIPFPRGRKAKPAKPAPEAVPTKTYPGMLRRIQPQELVLETEDHRLIRFRCSEATQYRGAEGAIDPASFQPGDQISVAATQDERAFLDALVVTLQQRGSDEDRARARRPLPQPDEATAAPSLVDSGEEDAPPRIAPVIVPADRGPGPGEEGPPRLARGIPPRKSSTTGVPPAPAATPSSASPAAGPIIEVDREGLAAPAPGEDPVLARARQVYADFAESLPNYEVKQITTRYQSDSRPVNWRALDQVTADVIYVDGKERYENLRVNGKPVNDKVEDTGTWSTGEFNTTLAGLFAPFTQAQFRPRGSREVNGRAALLYDFVVAQSRSRWTIYAGAQTYRPAYEGSVWIDKETFRVLRIEMAAAGLPKDFPLDTVESTIDYDFVSLGAGRYLLPVQAAALSCTRGTPSCTRNLIEFRNYRKFGAESTIQYDH